MIRTAATAILTGALIGAAIGAWSIANGMNDRPVIDPEVRAAPPGASVRVLVELRVPPADSAALGRAQDEVLQRLAGTGARLARRYATAPLLALEIDAAALARLADMQGLVIRVRADRISPPLEGSTPLR
jgi:hypothetical protein